MAEQQAFLVTGASGQLGRLVVEALLQGGAARVIATSRTPEALVDYERHGVDVRAADFSRPQNLPSAFSGATHLLVISTHGVGSRSEAHLAAIQAAKAVGVRHIFYTSHASPDTSTSPVAPEHAITEMGILQSGLTYTILRNYLYCECLLPVLPRALEEGRMWGAVRDAKVAWLTRKDCADAAAGAMLNASEHENKIYDVTGPRAYSYAEVAALLSKIVGRSIVYEDLAPEAYKALLVRQGLSNAAAEIYLALDLSLHSGEMERVTDAVRKLSGHAPDTLENFLEHGRFSGTESATFSHLKDVTTA